MNSELLTNTQDAATEAQELLGASDTGAVTLAGVAISSVVNSAQTDETLMMGGRIVKLALSIVATRDQDAFTNLTPAIGQLVVYQNTTYKVLTVNSDDINWFINVGQPSQ